MDVADRPGAELLTLGVGGAVVSPQKGRVVLQRLGQGEVFKGIDLLMNRDGAEVELLGLGEFAQVDRDRGQVVQRQRNLVMLGT